VRLVSGRGWYYDSMTPSVFYRDFRTTLDGRGRFRGRRASRKSTFVDEVILRKVAIELMVGGGTCNRG